MTNRRGSVLLLLSFALLFAALIARSGGLALLALPLLAYLGLGLAYAPEPEGLKLSATRALSLRFAPHGAPVEVKVTVTNQGERPVHVLISDPPPAETMRVEGVNCRWASLGPGETAELSYRLLAPRGRYRWDVLPVEARDPFGLRPARLDLPAPADLLVSPRPLPVGPIALRPRETIHAAGPAPARLAGPGLDFWGTRAYHPGDSLRWLVWRRMAREPGRLFTKEFEKYEIADVGLILDARRIAIDPALFEYSAQAAAGLAESFLRAGNRVSLLVLSDVLVRAFPGYGKAQRQRVLAALAAARVSEGANVTIDTLKYLPVRLFPSRSQLIFISPLAPGDANALRRLRAFGYSLLALSPDPVDFAARAGGPGELALRAARIERELTLRQVRRAGAALVDWKVSQPLDAVLRVALARPLAMDAREVLR